MEKELKVRINGDIEGLRKAADEAVKETERIAVAAEAAGEKMSDAFHDAGKEIDNLIGQNRELANLISSPSGSGDIQWLRRYAEAINENNAQLLKLGATAKQTTDVISRLEVAKLRLSKESQAEINKMIARMKGEELAIGNLDDAINNNTKSTDTNITTKKAALTTSNQLVVSLARLATGNTAAATSVGSLTRSLAYVALSSATATGGLSSLAAALMGPAGITIAISAVVSALTTYITTKVKANKTEEESERATRNYAESLDTLSRALYNSSRSYGDNVSRMNTLIAVTRDSNATLKQREQALKELQDMYPAVFRNYDIETIKTEEATKAYKELAASIIAAANARAAEGMIAERSSNQLALDLENKKLQKRIDLIQQGIEANKSLYNQSASGSAGVGASTAGQYGVQARQEQEIIDLQKQYTQNLLDRAKLQGEINDLSKTAVDNQKKVNAELLKTDNQKKKGPDTEKKVADEIKRIENELRTKFKEGRDKELEENKIRFEALKEDANGMATELANIEELNRQYISAINKKWDEIDQAQRSKDYQEELDNELKHEKAIQNIIEQNKNRISLLSKEGRERELAELEIQYNAMKSMQAVNDSDRLLLTEQYNQEKAQINKEWDERELARQRDVIDQYSNMLYGNLAGLFEDIALNGEDAFDTLADSFKRMIVRMLAEAAALKAISAIFGGLPAAAGGSLGGFFLKFIGGGSFGQQPMSFSNGPSMMSPGSVRISPPTINPLASNPIVIIPDVTLKGSDIRMSFNRSNRSNNILGGGV